MRPSPTGTNGTRVLGALTLVAVASTVVQGLFFMAPSAEQGEYARMLAIHPALAWVMYVSVGVLALSSALYLFPATRGRFWDLAAGASAELGAVFCALTLITGSIWGRPTWGVWWTWDARLTSTALLLVLLLGYLALRRVPAEVESRSKRSAIAALIVALDVPIVHFSVEWWRTLHQGRTLVRLDPQTQLEGSQALGMVLGFASITMVFVWLLVHRFRVEQLEERFEREGLEVALRERAAEADAGWQPAEVRG